MPLSIGRRGQKCSQPRSSTATERPQMFSKLSLCGLLLPILQGCATPLPLPLPAQLPAALTAPCQPPVPPVLLTNQDLAQAYLDLLDSFVACSRRHAALTKAVSSSPKEVK